MKFFACRHKRRIKRPGLCGFVRVLWCVVRLSEITETHTQHICRCFQHYSLKPECCLGKSARARDLSIYWSAYSHLCLCFILGKNACKLFFFWFSFSHAYSFTLFSRMLRDSSPRCVGWSVGWLVGWSVGQSLFYFFGVFKLFGLTAPSQMPL